MSHDTEKPMLSITADVQQSLSPVAVTEKAHSFILPDLELDAMDCECVPYDEEIHIILDTNFDESVDGVW